MNKRTKIFIRKNELSFFPVTKPAANKDVIETSNKKFLINIFKILLKKQEFLHNSIRYMGDCFPGLMAI